MRGIEGTVDRFLRGEKTTAGNIMQDIIISMATAGILDNVARRVKTTGVYKEVKERIGKRINKILEPVTDTFKRGAEKETKLLSNNADDMISEGTEKVISEDDRLKLSKWEYAPNDKLYLENKKVFDNPKYYNQETGIIKLPGEYGDVNINGFANGKYENVILSTGMKIDRYGGNNGIFFSPEGLSIPERAMAPSSDFSKYNVYKIIKDIPVRKGKIAPCFDQPGGGTQFQVDLVFVDSIKSQLKDDENFIDGLKRLGYIVRK